MKYFKYYFIVVMIFSISFNDSIAQWVLTSTPTKGVTNCSAIIGSTLFVGAAGIAGVDGAKHGVFRSTNQGMTWSDTKLDDAVDFLTVNGTTLFAGGWNALHRSTNNGISWVNIRNGVIDTPSHITCLIANGVNIYAGTDGGNILLSNDNGGTWTTIHTISSGVRITSLLFVGTQLFASTGKGIYTSLNEGKSWTAINTGTTYSQIYKLITNGTNIFARYQLPSSVNVCMSSNNGANWNDIGISGNGISVICLLTIGENLFAGTTKGVYLSGNNGINWTLVNNGVTNNSITSLATDGNIIYAIGQYGDVFKCSLSDPIFKLTYSLWLESAPTGGGVITGAGTYPLGSTVQITATPNPGFTFNYWRGNYRNGEYYSVSTNPTYSFTFQGSTLIAALFSSFQAPLAISASSISATSFTANWNYSSGASGYYLDVATDNGFTNFVNGFNNKNVGYVKSYQVNGLVNNISYYYRVRAFSSNGISNNSNTISVVPTSVSINIENLPKAFNLFQNYPNPFNPTTEINYSIPSNESLMNVTLKIYDLLGTEITTLVDEVKSPGYYSVVFDGSHLTSGIYYYQIKAGNFIQTKKLILIK